MKRYWNGHCWVDDPPMATLSQIQPEKPEFDISDVKQTLLEVELNPRTKTTEEVDFQVEIETMPVPEQPTPNLTIKENDASVSAASRLVSVPAETIDRSVEVFKRNPAQLSDAVPTPATGRTVTRDHQETAAPRWKMCEHCASEFNAADGDCPVCLILQNPPPELDETVIVVIDPDRKVVLDEYELDKGDGGSH